MNTNTISNTNLQIISDSIVRYTAQRVVSLGASCIAPGVNGPYYDAETEVRNMAHWCVAFSSIYKDTKDDLFLNATIKLADAILDSSSYYDIGVYKCREKKTSDEVNGVIGPAWIIEGLISAAYITRDNRYYDRALKIFKVIPFNNTLGIWKRLNTENKVLTVDTTFNHQLWMAAAGAMIVSYRDDVQIRNQLDRFISRLNKNMTIRRNGRIAHFTLNDQNGFIGYFGQIYRDITNDIKEALGRPSLAYKEAGYHTFNLYGFAILKDYYPGDISFFNTIKFRQTIEYTKSSEYLNAICSPDRSLDETNVQSKLNVGFNVFSFSYNSPAFELPRIYKTFSSFDDTEASICDNLAAKQIEYTYASENDSFSKNTDDPITLTTRIYEYVAQRLC